MAGSTKRFSLTTTAYQDISEGAGSVGFRVPFTPSIPTGVRIALGTSLPAADTVNFDDFGQSPSRDAELKPTVIFAGLAATDRVYARANAADCTIVVHRL